MVLGEKGRRRRAKSNKIGGLWRGPPGTAASRFQVVAVGNGFGLLAGLPCLPPTPRFSPAHIFYCYFKFWDNYITAPVLISNYTFVPIFFNFACLHLFFETQAIVYPCFLTS